MEIDPELRENVKKYFTFSKREYKASIALLFIAILCRFFPEIKNQFAPEKYDMEKIRQEAMLLGAAKDDNGNEKDSMPYGGGINSQNTIPATYFLFNPNNATAEDWTKLGLNQKQVHTILNYVNKGGKFKIRSDLKKIYGMEEKYEALEPFIDLPEEKTNTSPGYKKPEISSNKPKKITIELNTADSNDLDQLPGIGFGFARRIIKYRNALGGFIAINQLMEVWGFRQSLLDSITPFVRLDVSKINALHINFASVDDLKKHPYLKFKLANAIVNYRQQHGPFKSPEELFDIVLIDETTFNKLKPYLVMD